MTPDEPMPLAVACERIFGGKIKPATLRAEHKRGRLVVERIGRKDFVTAAAIDDMRKLCRVPPSQPDSTSDQPATRAASSPTGRHGSSSTKAGSLPQDAARATLRARRAALRNI